MKRKKITTIYPEKGRKKQESSDYKVASTSDKSMVLV